MVPRGVLLVAGAVPVVLMVFFICWARVMYSDLVSVPVVMLPVGFVGVFTFLSVVDAVDPLLTCNRLSVNSCRNWAMVTWVLDMVTKSGNRLLVSLKVLTLDAAEMI